MYLSRLVIVSQYQKFSLVRDTQAPVHYRELCVHYVLRIVEVCRVPLPVAL